MDYKIRFATPDDHDLIYALKAESVRPYVERIWGWDEDYQRKDFDADFSHIKQFNVIEVDGKFAGFVQYYFEYPYFEVVEIHLLPEYRGKGIGSDILRHLQKVCIAQDRKIRIGCFKLNYRAKHLYQNLGFIQTEETDTHYILEYGKKASVDELIADATSRRQSTQGSSSSDDQLELVKDYPTSAPKSQWEYGR